MKKLLVLLFSILISFNSSADHTDDTPVISGSASIGLLGSIKDPVLLKEIEKRKEQERMYQAELNVKAAKKQNDQMQAVERWRVFNAKKEAEREKVAAEAKKIADTPFSKLKVAYVDYMIIKNLYEGSNNYYVSGSQMKQVRAIAKATEDYYKNSIKSIDNVWQSAVNNYESEWAQSINTINSSSFNTQYASFVDLQMLGIVSRASTLGISNSNTMKDF